MSNRLNGKVAVITGGAQGFGYSMVERFSQSGAKVVIWDKDQELIDSLDLSGNVSAVQTDVTSYDSIENSVKETLEKNNTIDILVNNAGIAGPSFKTWEYPLEQWNQVIDIDLNGTFNCCKSVTPYMIKNDYGRIVNIASIAGKEGNPNASAYSAAKAAVIALTKSLGKELADYNIAVNCLWTKTAINTSALAMLGGFVSPEQCRKPEIVADAAHCVLSKNSKECTGNYFIDENILRENGEVDFEKYAVKPGTKLFEDLYLD